MCFEKELLECAAALSFSICIKGKDWKVCFLGPELLKTKTKTSYSWAAAPHSANWSNSSCPRQGRPALLSDGQMHGKVLLGRKINATSMLPVSLAQAACVVGCTTDVKVGKFVSFHFMVVAAMETHCPWTSPTYKPRTMQLKASQQIQTWTIDCSCVLPKGWESTAKGLANR